MLKNAQNTLKLTEKAQSAREKRYEKIKLKGRRDP